MIKPLLSPSRISWLTRVVLALLLFGSGSAWAQSVASYVPARTTGNTYTSLGATGLNYAWRNALSTDDNLSTATPIGFTFAYDGTAYTQFSVSTNGFLTFNVGTAATGGATSGPYIYANSTFSTAGSTVTTLAPFYTDQQTAGNLGTLADLNASLKYLTTGTAPNRVLTAEWINMQDFNTTSTSSFNYQVKLYEADGHIEFTYGTMTFSNSGALPTTYVYTLGINSPTGGATTANLLTLQTANTNTFGSAASNSLALNAAPATNSRYSFTPPAAAVAAPTSLTFSNVSYNSIRVNFVDNSTNETSFNLLRSLDNVTFTTTNFSASTTPAGTGSLYSFTASGLTAGTTYYFQVVATSEGIASSPLSGSQATLTFPASLNGTFTIDNTAATNATATGGNFTNFTDAFTALNQATVAGPLTFNVAAGQTFTEVPPALTKTGTATNTITLVKSGAGANPVIAPALNSGTGTVDYIVGLFGADYITFDGINLSDAASAAGTTAGQREVGYFIGPNSTTDGAQNNVIRNCTIALNGGGSTTVNASSIGIFVSDNVVAAANATTAPNSLNKLYGNTVIGPVTGIYLSGYSATTTANQSTGNEVGTTAGNTITATGGAASAYGVRVDYQTGAKTENNTITVTNSAASTAVVRGIGYGASSATGINGAVLINNNTVTLTLPGAASTAYGIVQGGGSTPTGVTITNNKVLGSVLSAVSGTVNWLEDDFTVAAGTTTITGNQITGNTAATTGVVSCLYRAGASGTANISGNYIGVTSGGTASANTLTGASGTFYGIRATTGTITVSNNVVQNNAFTNTSGTTASNLYGYYNLGNPLSETITGNTFTGMSIGGANTAAGNTMAGMLTNTTAAAVKNINGNTIGGFTLGTTAGTMSGTITGISTTSGTTIGINQNKIYGLTAYGTSGAVTGIALNSGVTLNVANNLVGTLAAPAALGLLAVSGIAVTSGTTANVYHNSVYLNAGSTGTTFGTSGIYLNSTSTNLDLRGNLVVNTSTAAGTGGLTAALRRTSGTANVSPANLLASSDYNLYNVGTPSATNLLYVEGSATATNPIQTLPAYKTLMATGTGNAAKEANAKTETVAPASLFVSTLGTDLAFLHLNPATATRAESGGTATSVVAADFDGQARGPYPLAGQTNGGGTASDIGADEGDFTPPQTVDVGATALTAPASTQACYTAAETVTVAVRNFNSTALALSGAVQVTVSGTITSSATGFATITLPTQTISSGSIAGNGTLPVTFPGTYDLSAAGTYTFNLTANVTGDADATNNALPGAANVRTVAPLAVGTASASPAASCGPTTVTLTATGATGGTVTWYSSADGYTTAIGTGSPFVTPAISATTSFQEQVQCGGSSTISSNTVTVMVSNPTVTATNTPVTRCGSGNVALTATSTSGSTPQYYTVATGGAAFATGASATVSVTGNTTYYVGARDNGTTTNTAGLASNAAANGTFAASSLTDYPLGFNVTTGGTLASVDVYPTVAGTSSIQLYTVAGGNPGAGVAVSGALVSRVFTAAEVGTLVTVPLGFALAAGSYKLSDPANGASFGRFSTYTGTYPLTSGPISVVGSYNFVSNAAYLAGVYNNFFNLAFSTSCEPATRTAIAVNVTTAPALTPATTAQTVCANSATTVTFAGYPTLAVTPAATATVNGQDITFTPTATTTYTVSGTDGTCSNTATVTLTVAPLAAGTASASPASFCGAASGTPALSLSGTTGAPGGFVWQQSSTGLPGSFTTIAGSNNQTPFTAPAISATTYYQASATCGTNSALSNVLAILVGNPAVATTNSPITRCGAGSVTLQASASAGSTPYYYATATSVLPLGSGATQAATVAATPATQTFYVAARDNNTAFVAGLASNSASNGTLSSGGDYPLGFAVSAAGTLQSVDIYPATGATSVTVQLIKLTGAAPAAGTVVAGSSVVVPITAAQQGTLVTVPLNYYLTAGNYKITNSSGSVARYSAYTGTYPLGSGPLSVTGSYTSTSSSTYSSGTYNSFFNLTFMPGCESARTAITVNVTTAPALTYTGTQTVCAGSSTVLTFSPGSYSTLTVSPATGASVSGSTVTFSPTATTAYTITGNDGTGPAGCSATATATITVNSTPSTAPTFTGTPVVCAGSSTTLTFANPNSTVPTTILSVATFEAGASGFTVMPTATASTNGFFRQTGTYSLGFSGTSYTGPNAAGSYYIADSDKNGTAFTSTLVSPAFSTVGYSAATISVQQYFRYSGNEIAGIDYSTNGGATWIILTDYTGTIGTNSGAQAYRTYALPLAALGKSSVQFRFYYDTDDAYYWAIDNVSVTGVPVAPVYAVSPAASATVTGNTITFSPAATTSYSVTVATNGSPCPSPATPVTITVNEAATWTGTTSTNWFDGSNWNNGCVPTRNIDALIPTGLTSYPSLTTGTAEVRTLTLDNGASLAQSAGTLNVYGDLTSATPAANVTLTGGNISFLGAMPTVTGLTGLYDLTVNLSSAAGTLTLANNATVNHALTLTQGTLTTGTYAVALAPTATVTETDASYVLGQVAVPGRNLSTATAETFGGIGLTLTPDAASMVFPGLTTAVRTTGTVLNGAGAASSSVSIKRYFDIQPATNTGLNVAMDFSYFDHERNGIAAGNVALFKSVSGTGGPWANQSPISIAGNTVTKTGITDFSVWTLGNGATNPLPVELAAFTADRQASNAALAWTTATEKSSRGFEVQMSSDGRAFRVLDFVASATPTSTSPRFYRYLDREAGKTGLRYYRLRQLDVNGTASFSPVRTVRFGDDAPAVHLTAAPNPFQERLTLTVELPATPAAPAQLTLTDAAGRVLLKQTAPALPAGLSQLELPDLAKLASGVYLVNLAVPGQPTQHLKVVKE